MGAANGVSAITVRSRIATLRCDKRRALGHHLNGTADHEISGNLCQVGHSGIITDAPRPTEEPQDGFGGQNARKAL